MKSKLAAANLALALFASAAIADPAGSATPRPVVPSHKAHSHHFHSSPHGGVVESVGGRHLELAFDGKNGAVRLYVLGRDGRTPYPIRAVGTRLAVKPTLPDAFPGSFHVDLLPLPQSGDPEGTSSRFVASASELVGLDAFDASVSVALDGEARSALFAVRPTLEPAFVCPMHCEGDLVHRQPGRCPVCRMTLVSPQGAHADHSPKHAGILFMAADSWHHIEGVLHRSGELRLYVYNDFTQPVAAADLPVVATAEVMLRGALGQPRKVAQRLVLEPQEEGAFLSAQLPSGHVPPVDVDVRIEFRGSERPQLFQFTFDRFGN